MFEFFQLITDSAFKQQRLPAWQPILTAGTVLPTFFVIGIAFIPIGIALLHFSNEVKEIVVDYTHCLKVDSSGQDTGITCAEFISKNKSADCSCIKTFELKTDFRVKIYDKFFIIVISINNLNLFFKGKVYMYYGLSNYYQNHRRYVKSRDDSQLLGKLSLTPSSDCMPFQYVSEGNKEKPIAPCGAIANSLFNGMTLLYHVINLITFIFHRYSYNISFWWKRESSSITNWYSLEI